MELLDSKHEFDRFSTTHSPKLVVARVDTCSEVEEEGMDLKPRTSLKGLMANRNKGSTSKEAPKTQVPPNLPPPPLSLPADLRLKANPNLRKKRPVEDLEKSEMASQKGAKQQKNTKEPKDKRAKSVESQDKAKMRRR